MTDEDKKKMLKVFLEDAKKAEPENIENDWSEDEILEAAKRILKRMGLDDNQNL